MRISAASLLLLATGIAVLTRGATSWADGFHARAWHKVASVGFEANLANWDADAEPDGLALWVQPLNSWGVPVAAHGAVHVELVADVRRDFSDAPRSRGAVCQTLGRWTKQVASAPVADEGYLFKLPLNRGPFTFDELASKGRMRVRLVVPGQGVFEAAQDRVVLLP